jgi:hypothetical protein
MAVRLSALRAYRSLFQEDLPVLMFVRVLLNPRAIVLLEGFGKLKNKHPVTSLGIDPTTFRLVAWCLNQLHETKQYIECFRLFIIICRSCCSVKYEPYGKIIM